MKRFCAKCGAEHERDGRYCLACHAAYMREWRKTHPLGPAQRRRDAARSYANEYKKRGKLIQQPCAVCGAADSEMHHPDHEQPLIVVWLCRTCHLDWHAFWKLIALRTFNRWLADRRDRKRDAA